MGTVVAWFHDFSDILTNTVRVLFETNLEILAAGFAVTMTGTWVYVRILIFAEVIFKIWTIPVYMADTFVLAFFTFL